MILEFYGWLCSLKTHVTLPYSQALRIQKVELGNDSMEYAETVFHLASIHISTEKRTQAINCLTESIRVFEMFSDEKDALIDALEMKAGKRKR